MNISTTKGNHVKVGKSNGNRHGIGNSNSKSKESEIDTDTEYQYVRYFTVLVPLPLQPPGILGLFLTKRRMNVAADWNPPIEDSHSNKKKESPAVVRIGDVLVSINDNRDIQYKKAKTVLSEIFHQFAT